LLLLELPKIPNRRKPKGIGGSAWESNPPAALLRRHTGFEDLSSLFSPILQPFKIKPKSLQPLKFHKILGWMELAGIGWIFSAAGTVWAQFSEVEKEKRGKTRS
jgi:hypothetical protein